MKQKRLHRAGEVLIDLGYIVAIWDVARDYVSAKPYFYILLSGAEKSICVSESQSGDKRIYQIHSELIEAWEAFNE